MDITDEEPLAIYSIGDRVPEINESAYVVESANVIGGVTLRQDSSIWWQAVIRADNEPIEVGRRSNIQDAAVLHNDPGFPLIIGAGVTVGHQAMLHGCTVGDDTLIGIQAIVMNGAVIGKSSLVAAGALVTEGKVFPDRSLIVGAPAKAIRQLTDEEAARLVHAAQVYVDRARRYRTQLKRIG